MSRYDLKTYIDTHHLGHWFEFGEHPATGYVDVHDSDRCIVENVSRQDAKALIAARQEFVDKVCAILANDPPLSLGS